ncbi:sulfotransferase [Bradyrhizobium jicamae]|uniref:sulfotransferase n=1 Tax=Bradyrhizobium jicamae TaxID=280332 RepID=UPI001BAC299B|nr:sulfotransferase [Bradyrhizobium jicamae]MBR0750596.1 sulfotransferase [Bradyrhizobium jicamae]
MAYQDDFRLLMISAMYENGGNTTHRFLDGHPELHVYPFESQLGNARQTDFLSSLYPFKYRYPDFPMGASAGDCYELFFDEEFKTVARNPNASKFRNADFEIDEKLRKKLYISIIEREGMSRGNLVAAFFEATFKSWLNLNKSGRETACVGYSPVIGFDADRILGDFPKGHVIHVVRNPWSGYADTIKRPFPLSIERYSWTWAMMQHHALVYAGKFPDRFHILRFEDLVADRRATMGKLAEQVKIGWDDNLLEPSWNGKTMDQVYPWGTIRTPTTEANIATMNELDARQKAAIKSITALVLPHFGYDKLA